MKCDFSYPHYKKILNLALRAGYKFKGFGSREPVKEEDRILYLRHDVDVDCVSAVESARIEHQLGVVATYFIMADSPIYSPFGDFERYCIDKIKDFGHRLGLHIDAAQYSARGVEILLEILCAILPLEHVVSFHKPTNDVLRKTFPNFASAYEPRFFSDIKYISDSRGQWRGGCPCQWLGAGEYPQIQILTHPIHWGGAESVDNAKQIVNNKVSDIKQYLKTLHLEI